MISLLEPIQKDSLIEKFVRRFENLILSGNIRIGEKLPSERELAAKMDVSRQVVHEGLMDLAVKGLVSLKPRSGWIVNDYRKSGSLPLLNSLFEYGEGELDREVAESLFSVRMLMETEAAGEAAEHRTEENLRDLHSVIEKEKKLSEDELEKRISFDFDFHLETAAASGNIVYPLLLNSCRAVYTNLTRIFYTGIDNPEEIIHRHEEIHRAIFEQKREEAKSLMRGLLTDGEKKLRRMLC